MRRFFVTLVFGFLALAGSAYVVLNSGWFYTKILPRVAFGIVKNFQIQSFQSEKYNFRFPFRLNLENVKCLARINGLSHKISCRQISLYSVSFHQVKGVVSKLDVETPLYRAQGFDVVALADFNAKGIRQLDGTLSGSQASFLDYEARRISSLVKGDNEKIWFVDLAADFYAGKVNGDIFLDYAHQMSYSITMFLTGVDLERLRSVNDGVFSQIQGHLNGVVKLAGDMKTVSSIEASLDVPVGGKLKASLLGFIVQYIPQSTQRKELEGLIKTNGDVPFEQGNIRLKNLTSEKLATEIGLKSAKFNLDLNLGVDINIEGGLESLLRHAGNLTK